MNPTDPNQSTQPTINNPLNVMSEGERIICEIKRHPFGIFGIYIVSALLLTFAFVAAALAPHYITDMSSQTKTGIFAGVLIFTAIVLLYVYIATTIYKGNAWVVTSDSLTQISQVALFRKQSSQLSLANLEDVTFDQNGLIPTMFGFGTLRVETAGERSKFVFPFCPNPGKCAREIIQAHDDYLALHIEGGHVGNPGLVNASGEKPVQQPAYNQPDATIPQQTPYPTQNQQTPPQNQ